MNWQTRVQIKHLFTEDESHEAVQKSMNDVADVISKEPAFRHFKLDKFRLIPEGDEVIAPVDYANKLLSRLYDYADTNRIWIA